MPVHIPPEDRVFLEQARVGHLATASGDGEPHVIPVCFVFDGICLYSPIDAKPKRVVASGLRRLKNLHENSRVSLVVDHYEEDWGRLRYVLISGRGNILEGGSERDRAHALLREKYPQYRAMANFGQGPLVRIIPERVVTWRGAREHPA
jgi:PPOX class probable F420-dependent enzyme